MSGDWTRLPGGRRPVEPIRVGVVGMGVMGADHARLLDGSVSGAVVSAIADVDVERARSVAKRLCSARVVVDAAELITADDVDAVVVASADESHEALVVACIAVGKPVLCEKPLAPSEAGARHILDADLAQPASLVAVGFMRRFDPGHLELKAAIDAGLIGVPLVVHCVHRNAGAPAGVSSAEVVTGSAIHEIDAARWLLGEEIVAVTARSVRHRRLSPLAPSPILMTLELAGGTVVEVEVFVDASYGYDVRCEVMGDAGAVALDAAPATATRLGGQRRQVLAADWRARFAEAYRRELQAWVAALRTGAPSAAATAWDGYLATVVAERAVESLETGVTVDVATPGAPDRYAATG